MKQLAWLLIVVTTIWSGCSDPGRSRILFFDHRSPNTANTVTVEEQLQAVRASRGVIDARADFERGDYRLVGVQGITVFVPGISVHSDVTNRLGLKVVAGTSDMIRDENDRQLNDAARSYALDFNSEMIVLLSRSGRGD